MPRPDAAQLIGNTLDALPGPDGTELRFMHYRNFGQPEHVATRIKTRAHDVGTRIIHLLETNGYTLTHRNDPPPADPNPQRHVAITCRHCGQRIANLALDPQGNAAISRVALQQLTREAAHTCPAAPTTETPDDA